MFLQEKLGKLRAAVALSMRATPAGLGQGLPPQLSPRAIEVFLQCDWLAGSGCAWVLDRVSCKGQGKTARGLIGAARHALVVHVVPMTV